MRRPHTQGILIMLLGMFVFTTVNASLKSIKQEYPIFQVLFLRNLFAMIPFVYFLITRRIPIKTHYFPTHLWRGICGSISHCCLFTSIILLPFADANVLSFGATFIVCILSFFFLKEKLPFSGWIALVTGFAGVAIIANPSGHVNTIGVTCALISVFFEGLVMVHNRVFSARERPERMTFYYAIISMTLMTVAMIVSSFSGHIGWVSLPLNDLIIFAIFGIGGGIGQTCVTIAYTKTPANTLAPLIYSSILWSTLYSVLLFNETIALSIYVGTILVIGSGLFVVMISEKKGGGDGKRQSQPQHVSPPTDDILDESSRSSARSNF